MAVCSKDGSLRDMIALPINIFGGSAFRAVADDAEGLKLIAVRLDDVTVIDQDDRGGRAPFFDLGKVSLKGLQRNAFCKMSGKAVDGMDLFGRLMEAVGNIGEEAALGGEEAVVHIRHKLTVRFWEPSGELMGKR